LILYHHTFDSFDQFIPGGLARNTGNTGPAIWFTAEPNFEHAPIGFRTGDSPWATKLRGEGAPNTLPVYLKVENPKVYRGAKSSKITVMIPEEIARLRSKGHDGAIAYDAAGKIQEAVVFDSTQVKSATGNRGTF